MSKTPSLTTAYAPVKINEADHELNGQVGAYIGPAADDDHHIVKFDAGFAEFATASVQVL